jgi:hypothetical protein
MIMPTRSKEFFFAANTSIEYVVFWDNLWRLAAAALQAADRVLICGYGMPPADQRARDLLLRSVNKKVSPAHHLFSITYRDGKPRISPP